MKKEMSESLVRRQIRKWKSFIPTYAYVPLFLALFMNFFTYYGTKIFTNSMVHYRMGSVIDELIPFWPIFILVYLFAYLQWIVGYITIARESKTMCYRILFAELVAKMICLVCFLVVPTTMVRPEIMSDSMVYRIVSFVYLMDCPVNLFPSIHCLESWMCFRGSMRLSRVSKWYKLGMFVSAVLVCASTVLVKQHVFVDVIAGIFVVEIGLLVAKSDFSIRFFEGINSFLFKNRV